jgi:hypothetical protein
MARHTADWQKYLRIVGAYIPNLLQTNETFISECIGYDIAPPKVYGHASGSAGTDRKAELDRSKVNTDRFNQWKASASTQLAALKKKRDDAAAASAPKPKTHVSADKKLQQLFEQEYKKAAGDWSKHAARHTGIGCNGCRPIQDNHVAWHNHKKIPREGCPLCAKVKEWILGPAVVAK